MLARETCCCHCDGIVTMTMLSVEWLGFVRVSQLEKCYSTRSTNKLIPYCVLSPVCEHIEQKQDADTDRGGLVYMSIR